jgi:hypothetical protein
MGSKKKYQARTLRGGQTLAVSLANRALKFDQLATERRRLESEYRTAVKVLDGQLAIAAGVLRQGGVPWSYLGAPLGISPQAAQQRWGS